MWGNISAQNQHLDGLILRDRVEQRMTISDISTAQKLARICVENKYRDC